MSPDDRLLAQNASFVYGELVVGDDALGFEVDKVFQLLDRPRWVPARSAEFMTD